MSVLRSIRGDVITTTFETIDIYEGHFVLGGLVEHVTVAMPKKINPASTGRLRILKNWEQEHNMETGEYRIVT